MYVLTYLTPYSVLDSSGICLDVGGVMSYGCIAQISGK